MSKIYLFAFILLNSILFISGTIYTAQNVPKGELPPPLKEKDGDINILILGSGTHGSYLAYLLAQIKEEHTGSCLKIMVLDEGPTVNYADFPLLPGNEDSAYWRPGLEMSYFVEPNPAVSRTQGSVWKVIRGGAMRLSHYAIELGSSDIHRQKMYTALGNDPQWKPEYVWGHIVDHAFKFVGPNITPDHANLGKLRAQESRNSSWEAYWSNGCHNVTGNRIVQDFNLLNGSIHTCGAEPSNVRANGERSTTENEYLIPEATTNPDLILIRDCKITRVLFDDSKTAIGVEGIFHNIPFVYKLDKAHSILKGNCLTIRYGYRDIIMSLGSIYNPYILELSGIGNKTELDALGIPTIVDNPNVGAHFKEGSVAYLQYNTNATLEDIGVYPNNTDLVTSRPGAFVVTAPNENMFLLWTPVNFGDNINPFIVGFALTFELEQEVEGSVKLFSPNFGENPIVDYAWNDNTLSKQARALQLFRNILYNSSIAARFQLDETFPGLSVQGFDALKAVAAEGDDPILHACCSTRMSLTKSDGVIDTKFKVFGVKQLRVGSMSIMRYFPGSGGQSWAMITAFNLNNAIRDEIGVKHS